MIGKTISHYKIVEKLGEGGMGVVYKAEDTKLERSVALKFLAAHLLDDDEAKQRFLREAKAAAALDHPNICTVHEIDEVEGKTFLAMAFLKGETLEDRIAKGPLPLKDALDIARQVAEGLQAAHAEGIVHRDIKPANVLVSPEGRATIMDFGLARLTEASRLTKADQTVGTAAYMSPEQMQGAEVDHRTDIWAHGCVLYEMVAGTRPFKGEYAQALAYEIVNQAPEPLTGVRAGVPMELEFIVGKCLAKDPTDRYQSAAEAAVDLRTLAEKLKSGRSTILRTTNVAASAPAALADQTLIPVEAAPRHGPVRIWQALFAVATLALLALASLYFGQSPPPSLPAVEFSAAAPEGLRTGQISLSPDGRHLVVSVRPAGSLWVRPLDSMEWRELAGTEGASYPFWSPDSAWIGFFADERLRKVALAGGPAQTIAEAFQGRGGSWGADGTILFSPAPRGQIQSVSESGGDPTAVTEAGDGSPPARRFPSLLPDGRHFLYTDTNVEPERAGIYLGSLDGDPPRRLLPDPSNAVYAPRGPQADSGLLLFVREATLTARPFDVAQLEFSGGAFTLSATPAGAGNSAFYGFSASASGVLAYTADSRAAGRRRLVWVDRAGALVDRTGLIADGLTSLALSGDGGRVAYAAREGQNMDVWTYDLTRGTRTRLTNDPAYDGAPAWSPDDSQAAFSSRQGANGADLFLSPTDGSSAAALLLDTRDPKVLYDWSRDGRFILYTSQDPQTRTDLWYLERTAAGDGWEPRLLLSAPADERHPRLSPDGRYVAYQSDKSGRLEVYVQPFPDGGRRTTVSTEGGSQPRWSRDGAELFYVAPGDTLVAAQVSTEGEFTISSSAPLFQREGLAHGHRLSQYDVSLDGQRFLTTEPVNADGEAVVSDTFVRVVVNWPDKYAPER